jgi:hypothetical protein
MINQKAVVYGILACIGLYITNIVILPLLANIMGKAVTGPVFFFLRQLLGLAIFLVPGFIAGRIAGERGFTHGAIVGVSGTVISALLAFFVSLIRGSKSYISGDIILWLGVNAILCGFGGMAGENRDWYKLK